MTAPKLAVSSLLGSIALFSAVALTPAAPDAGGAPQAQPNLARARADAARKTYEMTFARLRGAQASPSDAAEQLYFWSRRWMEAETDLGNARARQAALQAHLARMKELERLAKGLAKTGQAPASVATAAEFYRLDAEYQLAKLQPPAGKKAERKETSVKTVRPRLGKKVALTVTQPAYVAAYYRADIESRVAGPVAFLKADIGSRVKAGEVLVKVEAPDLVQSVKVKEAVVQQRKRELQLAARADVPLKESLVAAALAELDRAKALLDYATIRAPFDGVVTRRNVDPGAFVSSAATKPTQPLLTLERTDIVTIYMNLPDQYAPYVSRETEAVIEMSERPGTIIKGKVIRFAPSLQTPKNDRTMRVELDVWNGTEEEYKAFAKREEAAKFADLKQGGLPLLPQIKNRRPGEPLFLPGMYGSMTLLLRKFGDTYLLPSQAVFTRGGGYYIFEVNKDNKVHLVRVDVQMDDGKYAKVVVIDSKGLPHPLTGDEQIVYSNKGELHDGQAVRVEPIKGQEDGETGAPRK